MLPARPRARRYAFSANIELIDLESETTMKARTTDLSVFGCFVKAATPWAARTRVRLKITHKGSAFTASGQVAHVHDGGMGVKFSTLTPKDELVLEIWMAELRGELLQA